MKAQHDANLSIYEFLENYGAFMVENDIITDKRFEMYIRYKIFLDFLSKGKTRSEAFTLTCEECKCSDSTLSRAIRAMSKN